MAATGAVPDPATLAGLPDISELEATSLTACSIGDFEVLKVLGSGQCGMVLMVRCSRSHHPAPAGRVYALKIVYNFGVESTAVHNAFKEEYLVLASLPRHRNVMRYLVQFKERLPAAWLPYLPDAVQDLAQIVDNRGNRTGKLANMQYVVFEYYPRSLDSVLREVGATATPRQLLAWSLDVANGLRHLQEHHVLHRDIKLDNILVANDSRAVICDFGLAIRLDAESNWTTQLVRGAAVGGNQAHLAPEVLSASLALSRGGGSVRVSYLGQAAFEFGVVLYEVLIGRHPIEEHDYPNVPEVNGQYRYKDDDITVIPDTFSPAVKALGKALVVCDPASRLSLTDAIATLERETTPVSADCAACTAMRAKLATIEQRAQVAEQRAQVAEQRVADLDQRNKVLETRVTQAEKALADNVSLLQRTQQHVQEIELARSQAISQAHAANQQLEVLRTQAPATPTGTAADADKLRDANSQIAALRMQIETLNSARTTADIQLQSALRQVESVNGLLASANSQVARLDASLQQATTRIATLEAELAAARAAVPTVVSPPAPAPMSPPAVPVYSSAPASDLVWDRNRMGPDMSFMSNGKAVTRTNSAGWGIQVASTYWNAGVISIDLEITRSTGTYLFVGVVGRSFVATETPRQAGCAVLQADGDLYCGSSGWPRANGDRRMRLETGTRLSLVINMSARSVTFCVVGLGLEETITGIDSEVALGVCFGGSDQVVTILRSSVSAAPPMIPTSPAPAPAVAGGFACAWDVSRLGPNMALSESNMRVTRTDSNGWGCQLTGPAISTGIARITLDVVQNSGNYFYVGAANTGIGLTSSLRQFGAVCMQADGDLYNGADGVARTQSRVSITTGTRVTIILNVPGRTVHFSVPGMGGEEVLPMPSLPVAVAVCFGGSDQYVRITEAVFLSQMPARPVSAGAATSGALALRWDSSSLGADMRILDGGTGVTRTTSEGWGIQVASPWISAGILRATICVTSNSSSYMFLGVVSRGVNVHTNSTSMRQAGALCMQADGDLYVNGNTFTRTRAQSSLGSGAVVTLVVDTTSRQLHIGVNGNAPEVLPDMPSEVAIAVCFGGSDQTVSIVSAEWLSSAPAVSSGPAVASGPTSTGSPSAMKWDAAHPGPDMSFSNGYATITRTNSNGWGCQLGTEYITSGKWTITYRVDRNAGTYLFLGVASRNVLSSMSSSLRQAGAVCIQADGDLYVGSDGVRTGGQVPYSTGDMVTFVLDMSAHTAAVSVNDRFLQTLSGVPAEVTVAACFGGSDQFVTLVSVVPSGAAPAGPTLSGSGAASMRWSTSVRGPDISLSNGNSTVTRTNSSGWGTQVGSDFITSGVWAINLRVDRNSGTYLYLGLAGRSLLSNLSSSLAQLGTMAYQADGDIYMNGGNVRSGDRTAYSSGDNITFNVNMNDHTAQIVVNGRAVQTVTGLPAEVTVAACFGGSDQYVTLVSVQQLSHMPTIAAAASCTWATSTPGPNMSFSNSNTTVTRTDSSGWGCQLGTHYMSSGTWTITFRVDSNSGTYLFLGVAARSLLSSLGTSLRQTGAVCMQADGDVYRGADNVRSGDRVTYTGGDLVAIVLNMSDRTAQFYVNSRFVQSVSDIPSEVTPAVCFGGSDQYVTLLSITAGASVTSGSAAPSGAALRWNTSSPGPNMSFSNNGSTVTRTDSNGWGTQLTAPWISSGVWKVSLVVNANTSTYLYLGIASRDNANSHPPSESLRSWGGMCMQADGDLYANGEPMARSQDRVTLESGTRVTMVIDMAVRQFYMSVNDRSPEVWNGIGGEVAVAVCFGGSDQLVTITSAECVSTNPFGSSSVNFVWDTSMVGPNMAFSDSTTVTRTDSSGWGIQLASPCFTGGVWKATLYIASNTSNYLFVGVATREVSLSGSLRTAGAVCMQADGDLYSGSDGVTRRYDRRNLNTGRTVTLLVDMRDRTLQISVDDAPPETLSGVPPAAHVAVCFGGSAQVIKLLSLARLA